LAFAGTLNLLTHFTNHFITCHCIYHSSHLHVRQLLLLLLLFVYTSFAVIATDAACQQVVKNLSTSDLAVVFFKNLTKLVSRSVSDVTRGKQCAKLAVSKFFFLIFNNAVNSPEESLHGNWNLSRLLLINTIPCKAQV